MKFDAFDIRVFFSLMPVEGCEFLLGHNSFIHDHSTFQNFIDHAVFFLRSIRVVNGTIHVWGLKNKPTNFPSNAIFKVGNHPIRLIFLRNRDILILLDVANFSFNPFWKLKWFCLKIFGVLIIKKFFKIVDWIEIYLMKSFKISFYCMFSFTVSDILSR
jgi:hypothetical protein